MNCKELLQEIAAFDCKPSIFRVAVSAASHLSGFVAIAEFRTNMDGPRNLSAHGEAPEEALQKLLDVLVLHWSRCPNCGQHRTGVGK